MDALGFSEKRWESIPEIFRQSGVALPPPWDAILGPLRHGTVDDLIVIAQLGQTLDGRIATAAGHSHYINGLAGRAHLHRLRAVVDAVVVGVGTALADDPQLTVRLVRGPNPARVVVDPRGRLDSAARLLAPDGAPRLVITSADARLALPAEVERISLPATDGRIAPAEILGALAARGFRRILIEGGAETVSRFLAARCLDRLHVLVAPIILGSGRASFSLAPIERLEEAVRTSIQVYPLGDDVLLDCDLSGQRAPIGLAKKST